MYIIGKRTLSALMAAVCLTGCLKFEFKEPNPVLYLSSTRVVVPSDTREGQDMVSDTLLVTSNRSWTAEFTSPVDWVEIDTSGYHIMSQASEKDPLILRFKDNDSDSERTAILQFYSAAGGKTVEICQKAISYRLELENLPEGMDSISSDGFTLPLSIKSNTDWTLSVRNGATAAVSFSQESGDHDATVDALIAENDDMFPKEGTLVISATGCRDIELPFSQEAGIPYFRLVDSTFVQSPEGIPNTTIKIKTNMTWYAELVSVEGYDPASIVVPATGKKTVTNVLITHPYCMDFKKTGKIVVRFTAEGVEGSQTVTISQTPVLRMSFGELTEEAMWSIGSALNLTSSNWPLISPTYDGITSSRNTAKYKEERLELKLKNGYSMYLYSTRGLWRHSKTGLMFGGEIGNYLELPAIPDAKLYKFAYTFRETSTFTGVLADATTGVEVPETNFSTGGQGVQTVVGPFETTPGQTYRIVATNAQFFAIGDLILYYE